MKILKASAVGWSTTFLASGWFEETLKAGLLPSSIENMYTLYQWGYYDPEIQAKN